MCRILLLVAAIAAADAVCPDQCSLNGVCSTRGCQCDPPWSGVSCGVLDLLPVNQHQHPGAAAYGYAPNVSSWGGSILADESGLYHLFVAQMQTGGLVGWGSESECVHATSTSLGGPFHMQSVLVPKECHGPVALRAPQDGEYLLFHQGDGRGNASNRSSPADFMHHSKSPAGPFIPTTSTPASLDPHGRGCGMPTAAFHPNNTLYVVCGNGHALYTADKWDGEWRLVTALVTPPKWEDPTLWFDRRGHFHIVYHVWAADPFEKHNEPASGHAFSNNGHEWTFSAIQPFSGTVNFSDGSSKQFATRERPQMIFTDAARHEPVGLTSAVSPQPLGPWCRDCSMGACSQCKVTPGRDWTYTIFQPFQTIHSTGTKEEEEEEEKEEEEEEEEEEERYEARRELSPIPQACATPTACTVPLNTPLKPQFRPTYRMNESTIVMPCNDGESDGGWANVTFFGSFGIVDYDWSNAKAYWSKSTPMDCQERLATQAKMTKELNPKTKVWVYRNIVKALPWFTDVRKKINDPQFAGWFLPKKGSSAYYHDHEQTKSGDCGGVECGEYLWDHRNESLRAFIVDTVIAGPDAMGNKNIDGLFLDDFWSNFPYHLPWARSAAQDCSLSPTGGPSEIKGGCIDEMGLSKTDVHDLAVAWQKTMKAALAKIQRMKGYSWQMLQFPGGAQGPDPGDPTKPKPASFFRTECTPNSTSSTAPIMMRFSSPTGKPGPTLASFEQDLAAFLLIRSDYAWLGYSWGGCDRTYLRPAMLDADFGVPKDTFCRETAPGVFSREWTKASVSLDTNTNKATIKMKSDDYSIAHAASPVGSTMNVSVDAVRSLFEVSDGGEAGLMEDLGCAVGNLDSCPFGTTWFRQRLSQLGKGGGNSMRLGGGAQACAVYNVTGKLKLDANVENAHVVKQYCGSRFPIVITSTFWDTVLDDMTTANVTLVFGVNFAIGRANPSKSGIPPKDQHWSPVPSGFDELLKYTAKRSPNAIFAFELGNEPRVGKFGYMPNGETYAADCAALRAMVKNAYTVGRVPKVVCGDWSCEDEPNDIDHPNTKKDQWWDMVDDFNEAATKPRDGDTYGSVDALSLHWYPASSHDKHDAKEDLNVTRLDTFSTVFQRFQREVASSWKGETWAGETASLQNGGGDGVSNSFQSTTWLYDQLGQQGEAGVSRMLRESISVGRYAMVNASTGEPFPDFFSTILWREVVGSRVLGPMNNDGERVNNRGKELRIYSRCARLSAVEIVLVIVNLSPSTTASIVISDGKDGSQQKEWLLTAGSGTEVWSWGRSKHIALNGVVLKLGAAGEVPQIAPTETSTGQAVSVAPLSVALIQYEPATNATGCTSNLATK